MYQGVETFYESNIAFVMTGLVPQLLIQRLKYAERCGLWRRWQSLFERKVLPGNKRRSEQLKKPSMNGNVVVIFLVLVAGLVGSLACFMVENGCFACKLVSEVSRIKL